MVRVRVRVRVLNKNYIQSIIKITILHPLFLYDFISLEYPRFLHLIVNHTPWHYIIQGRGMTMIDDDDKTKKM
jgi:hypothetical protein